MTGDRTGDLIFYALAIILPLAGLIARRPALGATLKMIAAWIAIFGIGLVLIDQRDRIGGVLGPLISDQKVTGGETRIRQSPDGHFWANVVIDGVERRMLIDSGATVTAISIDTAEAAKLDLNQSPFPAVLGTANGQVTAHRATARRVTLGNIVANDLHVVVSPAFGEMNVIGMNFLSRLASWRVEQNTLILTPTKK